VDIVADAALVGGGKYLYVTRVGTIMGEILT